MIPTEHAEQVKVIAWADIAKGRWPELGLLFAVPNGANKSIAAAMKFRREGLKKGVPDLCLPVPRAGFHGCFVEMKRQKGGSNSPEQRAWLEALKEQGYHAVRCNGADAAIATITQYLESAA